jgi:transposase
MPTNLKKRKMHKFTPEFRKEAADQVIGQSRSVTDVANSLGIPPGTLGVWVSKFRSGKWSLTSQSVGGSSRQQPTKEQARISELEAKLRRALQERDILKKAAAYFAQNLV